MTKRRLFSTLFDARLGKRLRDEGIRDVHDHSDLDWRDAALLAVKMAAKHNERFTADSVWARIPENFHTHEGRALGAIMVRASRLGWIKPTEQYEPTKRPGCHRRPLRVWESLLT